MLSSFRIAVFGVDYVESLSSDPSSHTSITGSVHPRHVVVPRKSFPHSTGMLFQLGRTLAADDIAIYLFLVFILLLETIPSQALRKHEREKWQGARKHLVAWERLAILVASGCARFALVLKRRRRLGWWLGED